MITDAMFGLMIFGDACIKRCAGDPMATAESKERFLDDFRIMKVSKSDGSFEDFDVAVRSTFRQFMSTHPHSAISHWLNEVTTLQIPHPNPMPDRVKVGGDNVVVFPFGKR